MIDVKKEGILLSKTNFEFENEGVLNPAIVRVGDAVHVFYRAVRHGNHSTIGYCLLDGPLTVVERWGKPILIPEFEYETQGVEDPRIVMIDGLYYLTYTGYDGLSAQGALATSNDLIHFKKQGLIVPPLTYADFLSLTATKTIYEKYNRNYKLYYEKDDPEKKMMVWDKNVVFFPRKIDDKYVFLHRIRPGIQIVSVNNLEELTIAYWTEYFLNLGNHIVFEPLFDHESCYVGAGCPPIETEHGWLLIYHGVQPGPKGVIYSACAALLDLNDPSIVLARLPYALLFPEDAWELYGEVDNVVFPTGTALFGDTLFIYYGAADTQIACASVSLSELLTKLLNEKK